MRKTFDININKIRRITMKLLLKRKTIIALLIFMFGSLALSIYCFIIGNFVDKEAFQIAYTSLSFFVIMFLTFIICIYIYLFKKIPGKQKTVITYEYEFNRDNVIVKNISRNASFILNKQYIKNHYIILDVLVVTESFYYFFPNDETIKKELGFSK